MAIAIDGSGTITGISVGGIPDGVVDTDVLAANAVTTAKLGSAEVSGLAKAWVNLDGTGTVAIRASYKVSSITDNGTGDYTVNFTTAMPDANYGVSTGLAFDGAAAYTHAVATRAASSVQLRAYRSGTGGVDLDFVSASIFR